MGIISLLREPQIKGFSNFMDLRMLLESNGGRARSEKIKYGVLSQSEKSIFMVVLPFPPSHTEVRAQVLEEDFSLRTQVKRPRNEGIWLGMQLFPEEESQPAGPESCLLLSETKMHSLRRLVWRGRLSSVRPARESLRNCPWSTLGNTEDFTQASDF